jgi:Pycsar effector protein
LRRPREVTNAEPGPSRSCGRSSATETAWHIHAAPLDWTGKADTKASVLIAAESGVLASIIEAGTGTHSISWSSGSLRIVCAWGGICTLVVALLLAIAVVVPRRYRANPGAQQRRDFIYFGHLRNWSPVELSIVLAVNPIPVLSQNLVAMSKIAWRKHCLVRASVLTAVVGIGLMIGAVLA